VLAATRVDAGIPVSVRSAFKEAGMPQLNIADFAPQLFWLALSFIALYFIMARAALPRIANVLEERAGRIAADLAAAAQLREQTQQAIADYEKALADARAGAQQIARKAREDISADIGRERSAVDNQIAEKMADAEKSVKTFKESAFQHIEEIATETADALIARLLSKPVDRAETQQAVKEALGK
jgi:F-type H+-transporting ATPase subunit b